MQNDIKLFEQKKIRSVYDEEKNVWYFSVINVISILIEKDYKTAQNYWNKLAERLRKEGSQSVRPSQESAESSGTAASISS